MDQELGAGMVLPLLRDVLGIDPGMHVTLPHPDVNVLSSGHASYVRAEEHVGAEKNFLVGGDRLDDLDRVARGTAVVGLRLHLGGGVDVGNHDRARVLGFPGAELRGVDRRGERAAGGHVGKEYLFLRRENRCRLGHEVHAAEDDDIGVGLCCFTRETERVADEIGDVLHLGPLVVVREDDGVTHAGDAANLVVQLGESGLRLNGHA